MLIKLLLNFIFLLFVFVLQISFINSLPGIFSELNLVLVSLVFGLVLTDYLLVLLVAFFYGLFFDFYSFYFFSLHIFVLILTVVVVNFLLNNFFTNKSLYSILILTFFALFFEKIFFLIFNYLFSFLFNESFYRSYVSFSFSYEIKVFFLNFLMVAILFYLFNLFSKKFKPVFY